MPDTQMSNGLEMRWIAVTDERGRTRMEAHWIDLTQSQLSTAHAA